MQNFTCDQYLYSVLDHGKNYALTYNCLAQFSLIYNIHGFNEKKNIYDDFINDTLNKHNT